jgi:hypothetical protein
MLSLVSNLTLFILSLNAMSRKHLQIESITQYGSVKPQNVIN